MKICIASIDLPLSAVKWTGTLNCSQGTFGEWIDRLRSASVVTVERNLIDSLSDIPATDMSFFSLQEMEIALTLEMGDVLLVLRSSGQDRNMWPVQVWRFVEGTSRI